MKHLFLYIFIWIAVLTFLAGFLNGAALILYAGAVSHHTGNLTHAAIGLSMRNITESIRILILPAAFFIGSFISGLLFYEKNFKFSKKYGILLMSFALTLCCIIFFRFGKLTTSVLISCMLGIQNGMFIFYKGILIRTAHFTGYLTDAARSLGSAFRSSSHSEEKKSELKRSLFYLVSILCFMCGAALSVFAGAISVLTYAAILYFASGLWYFILRKKLNAL